MDQKIDSEILNDLVKITEVIMPQMAGLGLTPELLFPN